MCTRTLSPPADVVYGDVSELLVHGGLAALVAVAAQHRQGVFVGHVDLDLGSGCGGIQRRAAFIKEQVGVRHLAQGFPTG